MVMQITNLGRSSSRRARLGRLIAGIAASFAAVTCDLVTNPSSDSSNNIAVSYTGPDTLVVGTRVPYTASVVQSAVPVEGAELRLTTSDSTIIRVVDLPVGVDTIIVLKRGQARIRGTLVGVTGDNPPFAEVNITAVASSITTDSASVTFHNIGDTVRLRANVFDTNGVLIDSVARWRSLNPAIASIDSITGKLLARNNGTTTVRAIVDVDTALVAVTVVQQLVRFVYSVPTLTIGSLSQDTVVTVRPQDVGGTFIPHGTPGLPVPAFTSLNTGVITVVPLTDTTFRVTSFANDTARVRILAGTVDTTLFVTVGQVATSVVIQGALADTIDAVQDTIRLRARAFDARNIEVQARSVIWTSLNTSVATVDAAGLVRGQTLGSGAVTARLDAALDTIPVVVRDVPTFIRTSQAVSFQTVGDSIILADTVLNKLGARLSGVPVQWRSLNPAIATVDSLLGIVVARSVGTTQVVGSLAGSTAADTTTVGVINLVASVAITPDSIVLASVSDTVTVPGQFRNARGGLLPASSVQWNTTNGVVVSVSNGITTALAAGQAYVAAFDSLNPTGVGRRDSVLVIVTNSPASLRLTSHADTLRAVGQTIQYVATARNARAQPVAGALVHYRSLDTTVAVVDSLSGLVSTLKIGTDTIIATVPTDSGFAADTALLRVFNDVVSINVSPTAFTIPAVAATVQLSASASNSLGRSISGVAFSWASSNTAVATVDATGLVTGVSNGTANITVNFGTGLTPAQSVITVANPPTFVNIQATAVSMASINDTISPAVTLQNALGATLPLSSAQWSSDNPAVASVNTGVVVAQSRGTTFVRAQSPANAAVKDSIAVTVTNAPASIAVLPGLDSLTSLGRTLTYTATIRNARGDLIPLDVPTWSSTNAAIATINASGIATALGIGTDTIIGAAGTRADTAVLRVSNIAATVLISPSAVNLVSIGQASLLTVTARNALGNAISGPVVTWQTSNVAVATVSAGTGSTNTITATGTGSATITATVNGIANSITVTVANPPSTVSFTSGPVTLASIGDQATPAITLTNSLGATLSRDAVNWMSADPNIFVVSATGVVTAVGRGAATLTATSPSNSAITSSVTVTVTNAPATLTITPAGPTTLTSIGATANLTTTVLNAAGAVIASPVPAVSWSSNNAAVSVGSASGVATAAAPGGATITATAGAALSTTSIAVTPSASPAQSTISTSAAAIVANGTSTATITVRLKDAGGTNLATGSGTVTMTLTGPGTLSGVTNVGNGTYTATLTAPAALGSASVGAAINGAAITTGDAAVSYIAGAGTRYIMTTSNAVPAAGSAITVTAQLVDANNNALTTSGKTVTWSSTGGGSFASTTSPTVSGIATISFTTSTTSGAVHNVTATDNTALTGTSANVTTIAGTPAKYLVTPGVASTIPLSGVSISAQLADANNNPVSLAGQSVTWGSTNGGSFSSASSLTNAAGVATATFTVGAVSGTVHTVTGTDGSARTGNTTVTVTAPNQYLVTSSNLAPQAGSQVTITAQLADAGNNPVAQAGQTVNWSKTGTGGSFASATSVTNAGGVASVVFTVNTSSNTTHTVTATDNLAFTGTSASIVTGAGPATQLVFSVQPGTATVGTGFGLTVTAQDANSNTASGFNGTVTLAITAGTGTAGAVLTGGSMSATNGVAVFSGLTIDKAGSGANQYRLTASINAGAITQNSNLFTVNNPAPTLASLTPAAGDRLQTLDVVFTGTGFVTGVSTVNTGAGFTVNTTTVNSATQLTANITVLSTATTGGHNFSVTNPAPGGGTSGNQTFTVNNPSPNLTTLAPAVGDRLQTLNVVFTGTGFITGVSSVNVGANIAVNTTTVNSATQITANITIAAAATTGARNFSVTNSGPGGGTSATQTFTISNPSPTVTNAAPSSGVQGQTGLDVVLTGTGFIAGVTSVSFANPGITVNTTTVNSATQATVNITIGSGAATGAGNITATNSAPGGGSGTLTNGFTVNAPAVPTLTALAPSAAPLNQTQDVVFTGTGFVSGVSSVNVGANITVNTTTVNSPTQITANLTIGAAAATGARNFSVTNTPAGGTSGNQTFTVNNLAPTLTGLAPAAATRLQTLDVVFTGTGYATGVSTVNVGSNITVNTTTVNNSTQITANLTIGAAATTGVRTFSVTNGAPGGGTSGTQNFTISNPAPTLTNAAPNSGVQGQAGLDVVLTGTGFIAGVTSATFSGAGITVNTTTVNSATQATANITIGAGATLGAGDITVTNAAPGGGSDVLTNGFTVNAPAAPTLTSLGTIAGDRLQTLNVVFTGTGFVPGVSTVNVGSNITVNTTTVNSPTQITANLTIAAAAATGARNFSVTNTPAGGTSANQTFTVNNPAATISNAAPAAGVRGQANLDVVLTGTGFITGVTTATFSGAGITVNTTTVNSATQATANITIGAGATLGAGDITVTNAAPGGGAATLTNGFTVNAPAVPTLTGLAPVAGALFQTLDVVFTGTGFANGVSTVNVGADITINTVTVNSATQLTANLTISGVAATGARNFSVTNTPAGGTSGNQSFTVNNPAPTLTNVSPSSTAKPAISEILTLTGTGFVTGVSTVNFSSTQGLSNIVVAVISSTQITVTLDVSNGSNTGTRTISVTNAGPGGGTSLTANWAIN